MTLRLTDIGLQWNDIFIVIGKLMEMWSFLLLLVHWWKCSHFLYCIGTLYSNHNFCLFSYIRVFDSYIGSSFTIVFLFLKVYLLTAVLSASKFMYKSTGILPYPTQACMSIYIPGSGTYLAIYGWHSQSHNTK